jgi:hypothetical protein
MELQRERFEAWLFSQDRDRVIDSADNASCFLCSFLKETTRVRHLYFGWGSWSANNSMSDLPSWAMKLIDPGWCGAAGADITVGQMQDRYVVRAKLGAVAVWRTRE